MTIKDITPPPGGQLRPRPRQGGETMADDMEQSAAEAQGDNPEIAQVDAAVGEAVGDAALGDTAPAESASDASPELTIGDQTEAAAEEDEKPIPDTAIPDKELAEEMAYAEKPFLDAKVEWADKLVSDDNELLDWLASKAAEEVLSDYEAGRTKMTEAEEVLREKAADFMRITDSDDQEELVRFAQGGMPEVIAPTPEARLEIVTHANNMVGRLVGKQLEQIMSDTSLDNRKKLEKIKDLQWIKFTVLEILKRPNNTSMIEKEMETQKGNPGKLRAIEWGRFAARAALGNGQEAVSMLLGISEDRDEDFDTLMGEHLPDVVQGLTRIKDKRPKQATDRLLDGLGYLWSNAKQRYVKVFDKSETEVRPPSPV